MKWLFDKGCPFGNMKFISAAGLENFENMVLTKIPVYLRPNMDGRPEECPEFY